MKKKTKKKEKLRKSRSQIRYAEKKFTTSSVPRSWVQIGTRNFHDDNSVQYIGFEHTGLPLQAIHRNRNRPNTGEG